MMNKTIRSALFFIGLLFFVAGTAIGQQRTIRGKIISSLDKLPISGVNVVAYDINNRILSNAITDLDGNYILKAPELTTKIIFQFIGYKKKEVSLSTQSVIDIVLEESTTQLQGVEVVATKKVRTGLMDIAERDISMSIAKIDAEELAELSNASIDEALQGRLAGVDIVGSTGDPGSPMSIRIRGTTSINGSSDPLIVVDGIQLETSTGANFDFATATEDEYSQLLNIAPSDIKDIVVLKDAAATAVWGSKGAAGVLMITTKRGAVSAPQVNYNAKFTSSVQPDPIPTLNGDEYRTLILEEFKNQDLYLDPRGSQELYSNDPLNPYYYYNYNQNTDWVKAITQKGFTQDHNLSLSGGTSKIRYRFSAGYYDQSGTTINTGFQRISTRMNLDYIVSEKLKFSADISYTHGDNDRTYLPENRKDRDVRLIAYTKMPNMSIYEFANDGTQTSNFFSPLSTPQGFWPVNFNPVALARDGRNKILSEKLIPRLFVQYSPFETLRYTLDVAFDVGNTKTYKSLPQSATGVSWVDTDVNRTEEYDDEGFVVNTSNNLVYTPKLPEGHNLILLGSLKTYDYKGVNYSENIGNVPSKFLQDASSGGRLYPDGNITSGIGKSRSVSAVFNANYTLLDRYIIYGSVSREGNSKFGPNYRWGDFWALSGRYRISGEKFMKDIKWINDLSIRGSYGITGKAPKKDNQQYNSYGTFDYGYMGYTATYSQNLQLDNLRWERGIQKNIAGNLICFENKLNIEFDYYVKTTKDLLFDDMALPSSSGYANSDGNFGSMDNIGWELNVISTIYKTENWNIRLNFNVARSQNVVRELSKYVSFESGSWSANGSYLARIIPDNPYGSFYGYKYEGVYLNEGQTVARGNDGQPISTVDETGNQVPVYMSFGYPSVKYTFQPGDAKYADLNKDGNINYQDIVYLGDYNPLFFGGFSPMVTYKRFSINAFFHFRYGNDVINAARMNMENMYSYNNQSVNVVKRWKAPINDGEAPNGLLPRALYGQGYNWLGSDRFVEDGSFLRFKSLTVKYAINKELLKKLGLTDLSFWFTAQNIYLWSNYSGPDPEVSISGNTAGYDNARSPRAKDYSFGLNLSF